MVEDREATRGPVHLRVSRRACIRDLRHEAQRLLGLAPNLQRWIIGRALCVNDGTPVSSLAGSDFSAPFYLCVVESGRYIRELTVSILNKVVGAFLKALCNDRIYVNRNPSRSQVSSGYVDTTDIVVKRFVGSGSTH